MKRERNINEVAYEINLPEDLIFYATKAIAIVTSVMYALCVEVLRVMARILVAFVEWCIYIYHNHITEIFINSVSCSMALIASSAIFKVVSVSIANFEVAFGVYVLILAVTIYAQFKLINYIYRKY